MLDLPCQRFALTALLVIAGARLALAIEPQGNKSSQNAATNAQPRITTGKETTYITQPLRSDGYPDYVAALNQQHSEGTTPENNAAVLLAKVYGPKVIPEAVRDRTYELLKMPPLPEQGDYLVSRTDMLRRWKEKLPVNAETGLSNEELSNQFDIATERPWTREEFPMVAEWLDLNAAALKLGIEATKRPKHYWPYLPDDEQSSSVLSVLLFHANEARELAVLFAASAMNRTANKDIDGAWQDIMACHRLARLVGEGCCLVETLVGYAIEGIATSAEFPLAHYGNLSAAQATRFQKEIAALPPIVRMANRLDIGERYMFLDATTQLARQGHSSLFEVSKAIEGLSKPNRVEKAKKENQPPLNPNGIDWDVPLKMGNEWYDRITQIAKLENVRERREACKPFDADLDQLGREFKDRRNLLGQLFASPSPKEFASRSTGTILVALLIPALPAALTAEDRTDLYREMAIVSFALAAYRADHQAYPNQLDALVPNYLPRIPDDVFLPTPGPINYRPEGEGYLLWSVSRNGLDDDGISDNDDQPGDDVAFRPIPRPKQDGNQ